MRLYKSSSFSTNNLPVVVRISNLETLFYYSIVNIKRIIDSNHSGDESVVEPQIRSSCFQMITQQIIHGKNSPEDFDENQSKKETSHITAMNTQLNVVDSRDREKTSNDTTDILA